MEPSARRSLSTAPGQIVAGPGEQGMGPPPRTRLPRRLRRTDNTARDGPVVACPATRGLPGVAAAMYPWNRLVCAAVLLVFSVTVTTARADDSRLPATIPVEGQPLAANVRRLLEALDYLGTPLPAGTNASLEKAARER